MKAPVLLLAAVLAAPAAADTDYHREVAPVLRMYCAGCHNDAEREGGLSLETVSDLREGGDRGDPVKPGDAAGSLLIRAIEGRARPKMPPPDEPQPSAEDVAVLKAWIDAGATPPDDDRSILRTLVVADVPVPEDQPVPVTAAACSPDGTLAAIARTGEVVILSTASRQPVRTLGGIEGKVVSVEFSPDGARLLTAGGIAGLSGEAILWDVRTGERIRTFPAGPDMLYDAVFSPDGRLVAAAGYDRVIRLWNAEDGTEILTIDEHKGAVFDLAFHPDGGVLASASADGTVKLWRVSDGERLDTLNQPQGEQFSVVFSADGRSVLSAGADRRIHLWSLKSLTEPAINPLVTARFAHESPVTTISLTPDRRHLLSAADDGGLRIWSLPDLLEVHAFPVQPAIVASLAARADSNEFLAVRMDGSTAWLEIPGTSPPPVASADRTSSPAGPVVAAPAAAAPQTFRSSEPDNDWTTAMDIALPAQIEGAIETPGDADCFRFEAAAGSRLTLEVTAARSGSKLDSKIEVLTDRGEPIEQIVLQATRESWLTFRGKDSDTSDDFRLHNWMEMELNEFLYCNGEVVRLWHYPRGPDSGFRVYPGTGNRHTWFQTSPRSHALGQPCYVVHPLPPGSNPPPAGLPVFRLYWENDDDPQRRAGSDSILTFVAPRDGRYIARITDVRGFGGERDFPYSLSLRPARQDFSVRIEGTNPKISPGEGREFAVVVERHEGFQGPVTVDIAGLPPGFSSSAPVVTEEGQIRATGVLYASAGAAAPGPEADQAVRVIATGFPDGVEKTVDCGGLGDIDLAPPAKVSVRILPAAGDLPPGATPEFTIRPGETIRARVAAVRHDFTGRIELGLDDSGRNLPHGVFVDNIGLNGLLIVEDRNEREFQITASPIARPGTVRRFHLRTLADGGQCSPFAVIRVVD